MLTFDTLFKGIAHISWLTNTCWNMVDDRTGGMGATGSRTGVNTFVIRAGKISGTVSVDDTFWSTALVGVSQEPRGTGAPAHTSTRCGKSTWPTWVWLTYITRLFLI